MNEQVYNFNVYKLCDKVILCKIVTRAKQRGEIFILTTMRRDSKPILFFLFKYVVIQTLLFCVIPIHYHMIFDCTLIL